MDLDKNKIVTQDELNEPAPMDQVEERVEAEMKKLEREARKQVSEGVGDERVARESKEAEEKE